VVEHPKSGETLVEPKKPTTETDSTYRFETECKPGAKTQLKVVQETLQTYTVALLSTDMPSLMRLSQQGVASKELLDAYKKAAEFQAAVDAAQTKVNTLKKEREEIDRDQTRIRNNMGSVDRNSDLYKRYVAKLTEQETRVEALTGEQTAAEQAVQNAKAKLDQYVSSLSVD
jgi:chromosome segregation ATPase